MKFIKISSDLTFMHWHLIQQPLENLHIADEAFAKGGYGSVYGINVALAHNLPEETKWVVKLCSATSEINKAGYEKLRVLASGIKSWQEKNNYDCASLMMLYLPLLGFPQAFFTGEVEGEEMYGYIMPDFRSLGYIPFIDIENDELYIDGLNDESVVDSRLKGVYHLSRTLGLLLDEFNYVHGDLKPESIWFHPKTNKYILIDYDGGTFRQSRFQKFIANLFEPKIMGAIQGWLAPEILKEVNDNTGMARFKVNWKSDLWSFACCSFHLLTGCSPFQFLSEESYKSQKRYLKLNEWPSLQNGQEYFLYQGSEALEFEELLRMHGQRQSLWPLWINVFNKGFKPGSARKDYSTWTKALLLEIKERKPAIFIKVIPEIVLEGTEATLTWNSQDGHLFVNSINKKNEGDETLILHDYPTLKLVNEFGEWPVSLPLEIVPKPRIRSFHLSETATVKSGSPVTLNWDIVHSDQALLTCNGKTLSVTDNRMEFVPNCSQEVTLQVISKYGLHTECKSIALIIVEPIEIEYFIADREFIAETLPVSFSWKVKNADQVSIVGSERIFETNDEMKLRPKQSGEITLRASNQFFTEERSIYIEVLPVPKIDNLNLPRLPAMNIELPNLMSGIPRLLEHLDSTKSVFNKIFDEHDVS